MGTGDVRRIAAADLTDADPTPGMHRRRAFDTDGMWAGTVSTEPDAVSGWHHHGDHETTIYVVSGAMRLDFGPDGSSSVDAGPGDFVYVPPHAVHRESNPAGAPSHAVIVRSGSGPVTVNVDGPVPAVQAEG